MGAGWWSKKATEYIREYMAQPSPLLYNHSSQFPPRLSSAAYRTQLLSVPKYETIWDAGIGTEEIIICNAALKPVLFSEWKPPDVAGCKQETREEGWQHQECSHSEPSSRPELSSVSTLSVSSAPVKFSPPNLSTPSLSRPAQTSLLFRWELLHCSDRSGYWHKQYKKSLVKL